MYEDPKILAKIRQNIYIQDFGDNLCPAVGHYIMILEKNYNLILYWKLNFSGF